MSSTNFPGIRFDVDKIESEDGFVYDSIAYVGDKEVGNVNTQRVFCSPGRYASIRGASVIDSYKKKGLYPELLKRLRDAVQADGCLGIISGGYQRSEEATRSWEKFAKRDPRAQLVMPAYNTYTLEGLPRRGRIPLATARKALKLLPPGRKACGITAQSLREGMEVEREHRDVTRGGMLKTARIAAAHLCEAGPRYYKELKKMERKLKRRK